VFKRDAETSSAWHACMYSPELIKKIHTELQAAFPKNLVLLGGSYLYGEANEDSDLDFYIICPLWQIFFLSQLKTFPPSMHEKYPAVEMSITIIPQIFFDHGWYYVYGRDTKEQIRRSTINTVAVMRNCLKLALYHYLKLCVKIDHKERRQALFKIAQQLSAIKFLQTKFPTQESPFSSKILSDYLEKTGEQKLAPLLYILKNKIQNNVPTDEQTTHYRQALEGLLTSIGSELRLCVNQFSFINYIIYNVHFLRKGKPLFLFQNPDRMILRKMLAGITREEGRLELYKEMKQIVFPVIIF